MKQIFYRRYAINYKNYSRFESFQQFRQEAAEKTGLVFLLKRQKENVQIQKVADLNTI